MMRLASGVPGAWLIASAFLWRHGAAEATNAWIAGCLLIAFSLLTVAAPGIRFFNAVVGAWVALSAFALPATTVATTWNAVLVSVVVLVLSLAPEGVLDAPLANRLRRVREP